MIENEKEVISTIKEVLINNGIYYEDRDIDFLLRAMFKGNTDITKTLIEFIILKSQNVALKSI